MVLHPINLNERFNTMTVKTANFTAAQESIILAAVRANGNVASQQVAEALCENAEMNDADGNKRETKSVIAKMSRMKEAHGFTYARKVAVSKTGDAIVKKADLVNAIATSAGVTADKLDGLDKATKATLQFIAAEMADLAARRAA